MDQRQPRDPYLLVSVASLQEYLESGNGLVGLERAVERGRSWVIDEVTRSGLRGRGGGGFPTGRKWAGIAAQTEGTRYVVCNGAEGEPGTFKDRALLRANPYQLVEGVIIAALAVEAAEAFICIKDRFEHEIERVERAIVELQEAGVCHDCRITVVRGPDEYLFGEEKAMLEVIEGNPPLPRVLPPYEHGLFATVPQAGWGAGAGTISSSEEQRPNPTLVNNVETLSNVAHILSRGADWFRSMGTADTPGRFVCTVVGDVTAPGVAEVEAGTPLREVIDRVGGGPADQRTVKAVFSGVANPGVRGEDLDTPMSYEGLSAIGSGLGSCGFIVFDDTACMVEVARMFSRFLYVESCGQCPPCKLGSGAITELLTKVEAGVADDSDIETIGAWLGKVTDGNRCFLAVEERQVVASVLRSFPEEFAQHLELRRCPRPRPIQLPKIVDLHDGVATYDGRQYLKQPDWTYLEGPTAGPSGPPERGNQGPSGPPERGNQDRGPDAGVQPGYDSTGAAMDGTPPQTKPASWRFSTGG
ncbi:MAG: SLBB domain-containing protein [Actinobacteria bacterium]|nr:SLBB domain-containing protein [Actinomycetota bacterium]